MQATARAAKRSPSLRSATRVRARTMRAPLASARTSMEWDGGIIDAAAPERAPGGELRAVAMGRNPVAPLDRGRADEGERDHREPREGESDA